MAAPSLRVVVGSAGLAGHALPALALASALRKRGHAVRFQGFKRWRERVQGFGVDFAGGEGQIAEGVGPDDGLAVVARALLASFEDFSPDVVVGDALTLAPGLAAEAAGLPRVTLYPEVYPLPAPGLPYFSLGLLAPRTRIGRRFWRSVPEAAATRLPTTAWLHASQRALDRERAALGLTPSPGLNIPEPGLSLVATLPELEYPRPWPDGTHVVGRLGIDLGDGGAQPPTGDDPLVVVAPSTVKDPGGELVALTLEALSGEPVRVLASTSSAPAPGRVPANAVVSDWLDYGAAMRDASLVVCHGNHGTVVQALTAAVPVLVIPAMADDAEHGARVTWSGAGLMVPRRLATHASLRLAARRLLAEPRFAARAGAIAAANRERDPQRRAADLVEAEAAA